VNGTKTVQIGCAVILNGNKVLNGENCGNWKIPETKFKR